jgi:hypothetical protein
MGLRHKVAGLTVVSCASFALAALCFAVGIDSRAQVTDEDGGPQTQAKVIQPTAGIDTIEVETSAADVTIELTDGPDIVAEVTAADADSGRVELGGRVVGATLVLDARGDVTKNVSWTLADVLRFNVTTESDDSTLHVRIPASLVPALVVSTRSGDVRLPALELAKAEVRTLSGDVTLDRLAAASLDVETTSGDLSARLPVEAARIKIETTSGSVDMPHAKGALDVRSTSGDVGLGASGSVRAVTTSGDLHIDLEAIDGEVSASSISGDVRVRMRKDAPVAVELRTRSGDIDSDFGAGRTDGPAGGSLSYAPAGAEHKVEIDTTSGDVSLTAL